MDTHSRLLWKLVNYGCKKFYSTGPGEKMKAIASVKLVISFKWGEISWQFLPSGGSIGTDMFCNFYFVKIHKIANNSSTTEAKEKISTYLESLEFQKFFQACLYKFESYQILLNKISHRFLATTKLFSSWKSLIEIAFNYWKI